MLTIPVPLALGRFKRLPQRTTEVWQGGRAVDMRLALPLLLEEEAGTRRPTPVPTARMAERSSVRVARLLEGQLFEALDEVHAAIARAQEEGLFEKDAEEAADVADMLFDAVDRAPGALEWLRRHVPAARASGRRWRRARSRKR